MIGVKPQDTRTMLPPKTDVLNLEWSSTGRDREVANLICSGLRHLGYSVAEDSVHNYASAMLRHRPRLLYCADPKGAAINLDATSFARSLSIPIITFTCEGVMREDVIDLMFWGHIKSRQLPERYNLQWSENFRDITLKHFPYVAPQIPVVGAVGFDRYALFQFASKDNWSRKYGKAMRRTVGIAGGGMDGYFYPETAFYHSAVSIFGQDQIDRFCRDHLACAQAYGDLVRAFPELTFVLKEHPATVSRQTSEFKGLDALPNVILLKNEEAISDCISVSDIWLSYDSTTSLDAWLLGKPTAHFNPSGDNGIARVVTHAGSPSTGDGTQLQSMVSSFLDSGELPGFAERAAARADIIRNMVQWTDGKNHLRACYYFDKLLRNPPKVQKSHIPWHQMLRSMWRYQRDRRIKKGTLPRFERADFDAYAHTYGSALDQFHRDHPLSLDDIAQLQAMNHKCE